MINNLAKVIIAENGSIKDFEDTAFLVSNADKANAIQFYVPDSMNTSLVQLSFKRADGFVISNRQMELITVLDPASGADVEVLTKLYEYQFTESDRILDIAGQLQVSAVLKDGNQTVATPYFCLYVRKNIQPNLETKTEEEFYQEGLAIVEKAQIDINNHRADFNNPHRVRGDQVPLSNQNTTLITDKLSEIDESITNLQQKDIELEQTIEQNKRDATSYTDSTANALEGEINLLNRTVEDLESNKLNKVFNDIAIANNLAENDYFVLNSGNQAYRITVENMKKVFGGGGGSDHYKGDFISYEELVETYPIAKAGDYAFVNIGSQMIMYVWDSTGEDETMQGLWRETTSGKYVLTTTFANFQEMLLNGSLIVDTAKHYDNGDGTKTNIKESFETLLENYRNLSENDAYIVNYENVSSDEKVKEFLKEGKPNKVLINYNYNLYRFNVSTSFTETEAFTYYTITSIQFHNYLIVNNYIVVTRNKSTNILEISNHSIRGTFNRESFLNKNSILQINPATDAEITAGTNDTKAITPKGLKTYIDSLSLGYTVPTVYITDASLVNGVFEGLDLTNLQDDPNTIIYQPNSDGTNDAYTILGETAGTRTFGNFKGNMVYKIEVNLADGTWNKTNTDIVTQSELNSTIGDINSILDSINGEVI